MLSEYYQKKTKQRKAPKAIFTGNQTLQLAHTYFSKHSNFGKIDLCLTSDLSLKMFNTNNFNCYTGPSYFPILLER